MKIVRVNIYLASVAGLHPVLTEVVTDDGVTGIGEAAIAFSNRPAQRKHFKRPARQSGHLFLGSVERRFSAPAINRPAAARSLGQGWPQAIAGGDAIAALRQVSAAAVSSG